MRCRSYNPKDVIMNYGEEGDTFFIIMKGSVVIKIPMVIQSSTSLVNEEDLEIDSPAKLDNSGELEPEQNHHEFMLMKKVAVVHEGGSFGELSLLSGQRRTATIVAKEKTWIAILSVEDYNTTLGNIEQERLEAKINFIASFRVFG
jgi:CRP-like cAMP-binding protein